MKNSAQDAFPTAVLPAALGALLGVAGCRWAARALGRRRAGRAYGSSESERGFTRGLEADGAHLERSVAGREVHAPKISASLKARAEADLQAFKPQQGDDRIDLATASGIESRELKPAPDAVELVDPSELRESRKGRDVPPGIH